MLTRLGARPVLASASKAVGYVRHLSRVLFSLKASARVMAYFSAYFDESYQDNSPLMAVSGYLAADEMWLEFAERWEAVVKREAVPAFHWSDLETFNDDFTRDKGWDEARRLRVQKELIPIIKDTVSCGICIGINISEYNDYLREVGNPGYETPYTYAVRMAVALTRMESRRNGWHEPIAYLIERSIKKHKSELKRAFNQVFDDQEWAKDQQIANLTTDANRIENVPLQAADVVAYETWKDTHNQLVENRKRKRRGSFQNLIGVPHLYGYVDRESLRRLADEREYAVRWLRSDDY
ncbi:MAG TPA: DUF3800 domain-containing protein [Pyrinomonadaceae bacterium]|nr:DUF3800 domain-containing protein [Pyrinomonadaceae bacterium]